MNEQAFPSTLQFVPSIRHFLSLLLVGEIVADKYCALENPTGNVALSLLDEKV